MDKALLRGLPKVDVLMAREDYACLLAQYGQEPTIGCVRAAIDSARQAILAGDMHAAPSADDIMQDAAARAAACFAPSLRRVINATGIVLHTNLGRSPLAPQAAEKALRVATGYSSLEYDLQAGTRGSRHSHISDLLCELTGAEDAICVNNNAAAVMLLLAALCKGQEVVVSRGELVEIGGSFRIPEIMALSGCTLREIGTTNRTHPRDYEAAIGEETGALLKVHTSNYRIIGFTGDTSLASLVSIGNARGVPVLYDVGGGLLRAIDGVSIPGEPCVDACLREGADVVAFSGDKLLGGPQAGILAGKRSLIDACRRHPLARALRVDKMTLAALYETLSLYRDKDKAQTNIPVLRMIRMTKEALFQKAQTLCGMLPCDALRAQVVDVDSQIGGGTAPDASYPSAAVSLRPTTMSVDALQARLRQGSPAIVGRIALDALLLDVRTVDESDFAEIVQAILSALEMEGTK